MVKVLIEHGQVKEIFGKEAPELHPDLLVVDAPDDIEVDYVYENGEFSKPQYPDVPYTEKRYWNYPSIAEQLDMLYWDKVNGTNQWQQAITTVKATYPKDVEE